MRNTEGERLPSRRAGSQTGWARALALAGCALLAAACQTSAAGVAALAWSPGALRPDPGLAGAAFAAPLALRPPALASPGPAVAERPDASVAPPPRHRQLEAVLAARAPGLSAEQREQVARTLARFEQGGVDPLLVLSLIAQESRFDPTAVGPRGSIGLMQLQPHVAAEVARRHGLVWPGEQLLLDPVANVWLGSAYLRDMLARYGSEHLALVAYNIGPGRLQRMLDRGERPRNLYSGRVRSHYGKLEALSIRD
jgi:soluble lytic murein transglycosylase-like protein